MLAQNEITKNNVLKNAIFLPDSISIILPLHDNSGKKFPIEKIESYALQFSNRYGGSSVYNLTGFWEVYKDSNVRIESNISELTPDDLNWISKLAIQAKNDFSQEAISIYINGKLYIIV